MGLTPGSNVSAATTAPTLRMVTQNWSRRRRRNSVIRGSSGGVRELGIRGGRLSGISIAASLTWIGLIVLE